MQPQFYWQKRGKNKPQIQGITGVSNCRMCNKKALFNWEMSTKHGQLGLSNISLEVSLILYKLYLKTINTVHQLFLVLTIAVRANIVVPPGDNIHTHYRTMVTKNCCAPALIDCALGLKYLKIPESISA